MTALPRACPAQDSASGGVDRALALALADEMAALTNRLSDLAYDLGSAPETLRRHMASLQSVDEITQRQLALAEMLRSEGAIADRLTTITLEALRTSLTRQYCAYSEPKLRS